MSSWMSNLRNFGQANRGRTNNPNGNGQNQSQSPNRANTSSPSGYGSSLGLPPLGAMPASPSLTAITTANDHAHRNNSSSKPPMFFREEYAGFIVKGNFMTLAAKPHLIEEGEWLAHQIVEQNRLLGGMVKCVQSEDRSSGRSVCNEVTCPAMTAGSTNYPWIDTKGSPISIPAATYIKHIQTWVNGKIQDPTLFPTDTFTTAPPLPNPAETDKDSSHWLGKTSGFSQRFEPEIKNMYKQMFRCYAHLYWHHWITFWELSAHRDLNTCFVHFMNVGRLYNLLTEKDIEPMVPLIELWTKSGVLPSSTASKSDESPKPPAPSSDIASPPASTATPVAGAGAPTPPAVERKAPEQI